MAWGDTLKHAIARNIFVMWFSCYTASKYFPVWMGWLWQLQSNCKGPDGQRSGRWPLESLDIKASNLSECMGRGTNMQPHLHRNWSSDILWNLALQNLQQTLHRPSGTVWSVTVSLACSWQRRFALPFGLNDAGKFIPWVAQIKIRLSPRIWLPVAAVIEASRMIQKGSIEYWLVVPQLTI